jgi:hypothetical protein
MELISMGNNNVKKNWKQRLKHEFIEYWTNVVYLTIFFGVFAISRRLILAHYNIILDDYFIGLIKALVLAKVIMIASFFGFTRGLEDKPLIIPVLYKTFIFTLWVALFSIIESLIKGYISTSSLALAYHELMANHITKKWFGEALMVMLCFIPFFAFKELSRVMGEEKIMNLFFRKREDLE